MSNPNRLTLIQKRLETAFSPENLEVLDDSAAHVGHAGSKDGAGHYTVIIRAARFENLSRIESHRLIYEALKDLIPAEIHALKIRIC